MKPATRRQKTRRRNHLLERTHDREPQGTGSEDPMRVPVSAVMSRRVICVPEHLNVATLEELLLDRDLWDVPVVDFDGRLVGLVAMTDIVREVHRRAETAESFHDDSLEPRFPAKPEPRTVGHVMTPIAFELPESCPVAQVVDLMAMQDVHQVPITSDDGTLLGIVTADDLVRHLTRPGRAVAAPVELADAGADAPEGTERERLSEADRVVSLGFLAGGVSHQVNNALTPMRLSLGRLVSFELSHRPLTAERLHRIELLQDVREGVARIEQIIRELKAFSHTDGPSRAVDVSALLEVAIGLAAHEIRHRARLVCDYAAVPPVRAKPAELRQVFLSLLVNAAQAIPEGEAHVNEIRVTTRTDAHGRAVIEIKDTGTGIPADVAPRIFEPFFTARSEGKGLGLGLTVSRDIVSALDGEITVDSVVGKGTLVRIALPPCAEDAVAPEVPDEPRPDLEAPGERRRILILDDDRPVAAAIALELAAHDVVVAESGREALQILSHDKDFDVILCDLMMPEVSGIDVYEALRLIAPALLDRMVLMTGGAFTARARQFVSKVDAMLIEKPFHPGQLHEVVHALEHRRQRAASPAPRLATCHPVDRLPTDR
jgi:signal transduction histidine kinase/CheY-like chemotaxis protein